MTDIGGETGGTGARISSPACESASGLRALHAVGRPARSHQESFAMPARREFLSHAAKVAALMAGAGLLPLAAHAAYDSAAFEAKSLADALKALGAGVPVDSKDITLTGPDIAENGAVVPVGVATALPGAKRLLLMVEKNPNVLAAAFDVSDAVDANFSTRVKMGQSSNVYAVALMRDGRVLFAQKEIKVTLGGCGG
jgi:sulfur-oxidizing protein SoxY